jgi:hypothetical protein
MDHRNVREQQQEGRAAYKPKSSRALASRREGGGSLRRRFLVRRDDLLLSLDESRAAWLGGAIELSLGDDSADLTAALSERF